MLSLDGYAVRDRIHANDQSEVYTGIRQRDKLPVVLKRYLGSAARANRRVEHEFELLGRVQHPSVVRALELCPHGSRKVLVLERFPGYPLSRYAQDRRIDLTTFLSIAVVATRALAAVHDARIIHKDVKLANLLVDPERLDLCLIDFGIAAEFGRAERSLPAGAIEGTAPYVAPEQTGRMGRGIDFRTDLYSLGASLYELLTGQLPFRAQSVRELVTAHIALRPRLAVEVDARVPVALARILDKLLEKDPELRYQTARGLAADLETCQKQWFHAGSIDEDLALGTQDGSDRLRFPDALYGRERECAALEEALERAAGGSVECVLIRGPAGIGKTALVGAQRSRLVQRGGYMAEAKFAPELQERPFAGLQDALGSLVDQLLTESAERLDEWRARIGEELGEIGAALVELVPLLSALLPELLPVPALSGHEARERLARAVLGFVRGVARSDHPLVLFLDDLQWADPGSLALLRSLLRSGETEALLVICGYRDDAVRPEDGFGKLRDEWIAGPVPALELELEPLGLEPLTALLADALGRSREDVGWLARRVGPKSQHNPLLIRRLMFHLWDRDLIRYESGVGWVWEEEQLTEVDITDDAAAMVAARIDRLPVSAQHLVRVGSVIGRAFELEMLVALADVDRLTALKELMQLVEQGLLAPCSDGFKFAHDRLRESVQSRISADERAALHHRTAELLLAKTSPEELPRVSFQLAEHLSGAFDRLRGEQRPQALEVFRIAAAQALERGASEAADHYARRALDLIREEDWEGRFDVALEVHLLAAESALQTLASDRALELLDHLEERPLGALQRARVIAKRIAVYSVSRPDEVVTYALEALGGFGVHWSREPSRLRARIDVLRTDWMLRGPIEGMFRAPGGENSDWLAPVLIIGAAAGIIGHHSNRLLCLCSAYVLRCYRRHSAPGGAAHALPGYAGPRVVVRRDLEGALRYAEATEYWARRARDPRRAVRGELTLHAFLYAWLKPRREVLEPIERVARRAREGGDLEWCAYATQQLASLSALCGEALSVVKTRIGSLRQKEEQTGEFGSSESEFYALCYGTLSDPERSELDLERGRALLNAPRRPNGDVYPGIHWIAALCLMGQWEAATEDLERLWPRVVSIGIGSSLADYAMYRGLCAATRLERGGRWSERRRPVWTLARCLRQLRTWARAGPDFSHMALLLEAEQLALRSRLRPALRVYQSAAKRAEQRGYTHHTALCHERRARLLERSRRTRDAEKAYAEALEAYAEWGAQAKVEQLRAHVTAIAIPGIRPR